MGDRADQIAVPDEPSISDQDDDEGDLFEHFEEQDRSFSPVPEQVPIEEDEDDKIIAKYNALAIIPEEQLNAQTIGILLHCFASNQLSSNYRIFMTLSILIQQQLIIFFRYIIDSFLQFNLIQCSCFC